MTNPLGRYGPIVASGVGAFVVVAFVLATIFAQNLGLTDSGLQSLRELALLSLGAIFGLSPAIGAQSQAREAEAVAEAAHARLDELGAPRAAKPTA